MWSNLCIQRDTECPIQLLYMSCFNDRLRVPGVTSLSSSEGLNVSGVISRARDLLRSNIGSVSSSLQASVAQQPKRRRIGHQYTHKSVKQPEQKTLEISVVDFMAREEFVDENGIMHQSIETPAPRPPGHTGGLTRL